MKEFLIVMLYAVIAVSLFGMAAFLIYNQVSGWGWFLFVVIIYVGSLKWNVK